MKKNGITEYFEEVETEEKYNGYFCRIPEMITIVILRSMCGLRNVSQIRQWAASERVSGFLKEKFTIEHVSCYYSFFRFTEGKGLFFILIVNLNIINS